MISCLLHHVGMLVLLHVVSEISILELYNGNTTSKH